ncbi:OmpA family protein [Saprospira sp. CCB-QB6]|uniref:OmpA family protein n=1 Tax=Saprospira sp. CCB-QB6 TaxID=3023936 RepID=UPI00234ADC51|nr:OmpA family protein [Saprospira sp. CCB-QB6]WCL82535.1 OmpA family protein [Saprospira sp. CCB-QB6]
MRFFLYTLSLILLPQLLIGQIDRKRYRFISTNELFFNSGSYQLDTQNKAKLKALVDQLASEELEKIVIQAHTDSIGSSLHNNELAKNRANSVAQELLKQGIDSAFIDLRTYGEFSPIANNDTEEGRAKNRRVSVYALAPYDPSQFHDKCKITGRLTDSKTDAPLANAQVLMLRMGRQDTLTTDANGLFEQVVGNFRQLELRAYAKNYFFANRLLKTPETDSIYLNIQLEPALLGGKIQLSDLYFQAGTAELLSNSEKALNEIADFMRYNAELKFELGGHINKPNRAPVPPQSRSYQLSEARAKAIYDYLIQKGIKAERLKYRGYGNWEMIYPRAESALEQQLNRRVELKIIQ